MRVMGVRIDVDYTGELHCRLVHGPSGTEIETDAPQDNAGKGEAFSPTDLLAASLTSCMLTTMAIKARPEGIELERASGTVEKRMTTESPRRVRQLIAELHLPEALAPAQRARLEEIARTCPVSLSLSPEVRVDLSFVYDL